MNWEYANRFGELDKNNAMMVEALVKIAEQLEQLNKNVKALRDSDITIRGSDLKVRVSGGINTHAY